jgi:uroporphyrinogen-III synthase
LNSAKIIVTRPRDQLDQAIASIQQNLTDQDLDIEVLGLPLLEIVPEVNPALAEQLYQGLCNAQWLSFVSPNAFLAADQLLHTFQYDWPSHLKLALIGGGTEKAILASRFKPALIVKPADESQWDSEGLWLQLMHQEKNWSGKKILVVRGDTGREWLVNQWQSEEALVQSISIYKRKNLDQQDPYWQNFLSMWKNLSSSPSHSQRKQLFWVMSSSQACQYLSETLMALNLKEVILNCSVALATHEKIAQSAEKIGFSKVIHILPGPENISQPIKEWINN